MNMCRYTKLIQKCFPQIRVRNTRPILDGWDNFVLEVDEKLIFRFPRRPEAEIQLEKEITLLPELAKALSVAIPHFEYVWPGGEGWEKPFVGYRKIEGEPLTKDRLGSMQAREVAQQLAQFLSELHRFPAQLAADLKVPAASPALWRQEYLDFYERVREQVFPLLDERKRGEMVALWEAFLGNDTHFQFRPVLLHRDLSGEHILCDSSRGTIGGVIDWGDASLGDPAFDFTGLVYGYGLDFARRVLDDYKGEVDETFLDRATFYAELPPFHEVLFGLAAGNEDHVNCGLAALREDA